MRASGRGVVSGAGVFVMPILNVQWKKFRIKVVVLLILLICGPIIRAENPWYIRINIPEYKLYLYRGGDSGSFF